MNINPNIIYNKELVKMNKSLSKAEQILFKEGDTIKGEILDSSQTRVKIRLADNRIIEAKIINNESFSIGNKVTFKVKNSSLESLVLTVDTIDKKQIMNDLVRILMNANLPETDENMELVKFLVEKKMPVDSNTVKTLANSIRQYPEATLRQLQFMTQHNIPITKANVEQMIFFEKNEHTLIKGITILVEKIINEEQGVLPNKVLKQEELLALKPNNNNLIGEKIELLEYISKDTKAKDFQKVLTNILENKSLSKDMKKIISEQPIKDMILGKESDKLIAELNSKLEAYVSKLSTKTDSLIETKKPDLLGPSSEAIIPKDIKLLDLLSMTKDGFISHTQLRDFLLEIKGQSLYSTVIKGLLLTESDLKDTEAIKDYFGNLHNKITTLLEAINGAKIGVEIGEQASSIKASIEFLNVLNQDFNILNMPLFLKNQLLNAELYIMDKKKRIKDKKKNIKVLIRLDLLNLGHMDIHINKVDKNLAIQIFMTDKNSIDMVKENVAKLKEKLDEKGFNSQPIVIQPLKEEFDIVKDFLEEDNKSKEVKRYTFDMRA